METGTGGAEKVTLRYVETTSGDPWSPAIERHVVQRLDDDWEAWIALERLPGGVDLDAVGLEVRPRRELAAPLRAATFARGVRLSAAVKYGRIRAQEPALQHGPGWIPRRVDHPGRRGHSLAYLAEIAAYYVEAAEEAARMTSAARADKHADAASRRVNFMGGLAVDLDMSERTLRETLRKARRRGLLTRAPNGAAGGKLTDLGRALLRPSPAALEVEDGNAVIRAGERALDNLRWDLGRNSPRRDAG